MQLRFKTRDLGGETDPSKVTIILYGDTYGGNSGVLLKTFPATATGWLHLNLQPGLYMYYSIVVKNRLNED